MCGRTCLTLAPDELKCACKYEKEVEGGEDEKNVPEYRDEYNLGLEMSEKLLLLALNFI
jgi:hypothetical protein